MDQSWGSESSCSHVSSTLAVVLFCCLMFLVSLHSSRLAVQSVIFNSFFFIVEHLNLLACVCEFLSDIAAFGFFYFFC